MIVCYTYVHIIIPQFPTSFTKNENEFKKRINEFLFLKEELNFAVNLEFHNYG